MKKFAAYVFISLLIYSCSASINSLYSFDYTLTSQKAFSRNTNISVNIPDGWFTAVDNEYNRIDLWLIKNDFSQSLSFTVINADEETKKNIQKNGISKLAEYSKISIRAELGNSFKGFFNDENFDLGKNQFYAFQYNDKNAKTIRIVLFEHKNRFYQLTAISSGSNNYEQLWAIQNTVLTSLN